jgi:hypothetical protein
MVDALVLKISMGREDLHIFIQTGMMLFVSFRSSMYNP